MVMEAHQNFGALIDLSCCSGIQVVVENGVTIVGPTNLAAAVGADASALYARNLLDFMKLLFDKEGQLVINLEDDIVAACLMCRDGQIVRKNG